MAASKIVKGAIIGDRKENIGKLLKFARVRGEVHLHTSYDEDVALCLIVEELERKRIREMAVREVLNAKARGICQLCRGSGQLMIGGGYKTCIQCNGTGDRGY